MPHCEAYEFSRGLTSSSIPGVTVNMAELETKLAEVRAALTAELAATEAKLVKDLAATPMSTEAETLTRTFYFNRAPLNMLWSGCARRMAFDDDTIINDLVAISTEKVGGTWFTSELVEFKIKITLHELQAAIIASGFPNPSVTLAASTVTAMQQFVVPRLSVVP